MLAFHLDFVFDNHVGIEATSYSFGLCILCRMIWKASSFVQQWNGTEFLIENKTLLPGAISHLLLELVNNEALLTRHEVQIKGLFFNVVL